MKSYSKYIIDNNDERFSVAAKRRLDCRLQR
jgi:hypothetical protein